MTVTARIHVNERRPTNPFHPKPKKLHARIKASMKAPTCCNQMIPEFPDDAPKRVMTQSATTIDPDTTG